MVPTETVEQQLTELAGEPTTLPAGVITHGGPHGCPACGSTRVMWGCDREMTLKKSDIHPLVWHETEWMADSFICRDCDAGWIEPDDPEPISWVRPFWLVTN